MKWAIYISAALIATVAAVRHQRHEGSSPPTPSSSSSASATSSRNTTKRIPGLAESMLLSPEYTRVFQDKMTSHKPFYNLETGRKSDDPTRIRHYHKGKELLVPLRDLTLQEKTMGDRRNTQKYGLAHGLYLSQMLSKDERRDIQREITGKEKSLGRRLYNDEKQSEYQRYAIGLGIASKEWFANRLQEQNRNRAEGGAGRIGTVVSPSKEKIAAQSPILKRNSVGGIQQKQSRPTERGLLGVKHMSTKGSSTGNKASVPLTDSAVQSTAPPDQAAKSRRPKRKRPVQHPKVHQALPHLDEDHRSKEVNEHISLTPEITGPSRDATKGGTDMRLGVSSPGPSQSPLQHHFASLSPQDIRYAPLPSPVWVNKDHIIEHETHDLFAPPILDYQHDEYHFHNTHLLDEAIHSPRFSGEDLQLPHGLQYDDLAPHHHPR